MTPGLDLDTYTFKLVILGHYSVGKSSIVLNFIKNEFNPNEESTIGAAFLTKTVFIDGTAVKFEIWDTAGQERYYSLIPMYYRGANAALVVYDITSAESFERAKRWIEDLKTEKPDNFMKVLIGNKVDLSEAAVITEEMGKQYAEQEGLLFYQTSAKTGEGIKDLFLELATILPKDQAKSNQMNDLLKKNKL
ncbi:hypothetical protein EBI_21682, partial [Enterocytozoon bieneusi H348]